jgi:poly(3-hydroxybutyrate) depolymerase
MLTKRLKSTLAINSFWLFLIFFVGTTAFAAPALTKFPIDSKQITVSGVSSGGFMAVQLQVAHSSLIHGVGSVAGGIYWCAEGNQFTSLQHCMLNPENIQVSQHVDQAKEQARAGLLDPLQNLSATQVYIFASQKDPVISYRSSEKLKAFYEQFAPKKRIHFENSVATGHGFPTENYGIGCLDLGLPWILNCGFDTAGAILSHLYGPLKAKKPAVASHLSYFDQAEFAQMVAKPSVNARLFSTGSIYVPDACSKGSRTKCALHVALHGCGMNPNDIGDQFSEHAGYNEWAEANRVVVLYPQAAKSFDNPYGCWDWVGYTGANYATKDGVQIKALRAMIKRLSGI